MRSINWGYRQQEQAERVEQQRLKVARDYITHLHREMDQVQTDYDAAADEVERLRFSTADHDAELVAERAVVLKLQGVVRELRAETLRAHVWRIWINFWSMT